MAVQLKQRITLDEFEAFIKRAENVERIFELIGGEIIEVPSNPLASEIANLISFFILLFIRQNSLKGHVTGEAGGYMVSGERYAPDVAFISYERQPELAGQGYNPNPPELAVEVISDLSSAEEQRRLRFKIASYLAAGVIVWVVNSQDHTVEVYEAGKPVQMLDESGTLAVEHILPGFRLAVKDIFPEKPRA